ncbi:hypothetical protein [Halorubrum sodomense]|uniref:Envelope protein N-terminal domain-containing protein n=1 Tax=Halorubrum sodomense TaxID=35743 RepID=A0A1I6FKF8_HALSD|nr:hypothetical protein [Halorubrum sodomense]SFR30378.1 hypothetical protein SAMN04487937_0198 [Halorubrum sodomense]
MRTTAVGIGAAAGVGALGSTAGSVSAFDVDWSDLGTIAASTVIGGPIGLGWALRDTGVLGSDAPAEGLTASALKQDVYQTARTRKSTNASTIVDNKNIIDGVKNNAYTEAKIAAIEELNAGSSESEVLDSATAAVDSYETTIVSNLFKSWNESISEVKNTLNTVDGHPDVTYPDVVHGQPDGNGEFTFRSGTVSSTSRTLPDGSTMDVKEIELFYKRETDFSNTVVLSLFNPSTTGNDMFPDYNTDLLLIWDVDGVDGPQIPMLRCGSSEESWKTVYDEMTTEFQNARDGISTWVSSVYGDVQSGEIEISELITPRERAAMLSSEESKANAIADLAALNIPIDPEREVTVTIAETGATLSGTIGLTDESDGPIESGETYDPSTFAGDVYLTADVSQISGTWDAYETGVDGGTITLTAQPYEGTVLNVTTTAGETVSVPATDWTDNGDGTYSYDASGDLETNITEVESVGYESADDETQYETLNLSRSFTVDSIVNQETGENTSSASFESTEPQSDSNYITQEEWNQLEQQNQELIEKFEESQSTGGAGAGFFSGSSPDVGLITAGIGSLGVLYALFGQGEN